MITYKELLVRDCEQSLYSPNGLAITKRGMCNATRVRDQYGTLHDYIRAIGNDDKSRILHATVSSDGLSIKKLFLDPVLEPGTNATIPDEMGCEDSHAVTWMNPQTNSLGVLMLYVGYAGCDEKGFGRNSIVLSISDDFYHFDKIGVLDNGDIPDKDCVPLICDNHVYVYRRPMYYDTMGWGIMVSDLDLEKLELKDLHEIKPDSEWEEARIGASFAFPLEDHIILGYHGVDIDGYTCDYSIGFMALDRKDPSKIMYKTREPALVPKTDIEVNGFENNKPPEEKHNKRIVIGSGYSLHDNVLRIVYGAGDTDTKTASIRLEDLISNLIIERNRVSN